MLRFSRGQVRKSYFGCRTIFFIISSQYLRFIRKNVDPEPLSRHGLTDELLVRLSSAGVPPANTSASVAAHPSSASLGGLGSTPGGASSANTSAVDGAAAAAAASKTPASVSTTISLLSTLCRGSSGITHSLLRGRLPEALECALFGDERCVLDTMRLVDLLIVLIFEGRKALPRAVSAQHAAAAAAAGGRGGPGGMGALKRMDSAGEKTHRQLIDCIRSKDTDALVEAVEGGSVEVNFMDDVGQTLLNWAAAFGTHEMVEFLCQRGADVNKGQRSSSLHYAACFGRPQIARVLLRYGANPDLRDEDGKTPLDKARERSDEGHREVASILQSPADW